MRASNFFLLTYKESPNDAEIISHQLMMRAGMLKKLSSGLYTWLPLGLRVLQKVENIVRTEMDKSGALECFMPAVQPAELWQESGRWDNYGPLLLKMTDQNMREYCFGPTHEEIITDVIRQTIRSYKQLPLNLYQIQTKFRDEIRPRFGVMRAREFIMKDAYSFDIDVEGMRASYDLMYRTYCQIFDKIGLNYRAVQADTGSIGGNFSHEFQLLADSGEDLIFYSDGSDYAANLEQATAFDPTGQRDQSSGTAMTLVDTPSLKTIESVSHALKVAPSQSVKTLIVHGTQSPLVALILRGDHQLNEIKAQKHPLIASPLTFATDEEILAALNVGPGSIGPVNLTIPYLVDRDAVNLADFVCGANQEGKHFTHVNWGRDLPEPESELIADLRNVVEGDRSPDGKGVLKSCRGIEVGHIFQLGDKYSQSMKATVLNAEGKSTTLQMGCYGIGVSRIVAAAIEQNHDARGIIWPDSIAPFQIALIPVNMHKSQRLRTAADALYQRLIELGYEVFFDDRNERVGVLFADMDLIGIPHRIILSDKGIDAGTIEYKHRTAQESEYIQEENLLSFLQEKCSSRL